MSRLARTIFVVALLSGCTERALTFDWLESLDLAGAGDGAIARGDGMEPGLKPPGTLPQAYCARIITLSDSAQLSLFDPVALTFHDTFKLPCQAQGGAGPYSIALDHAGTLWIEYSDGELFTTDVAKQTCLSMGLMPDQQGFHSFDMTFALDPASGAEQLFLSAVAPFGKSGLGELDPTSLQIRRVADMKANVELTTTSNGDLWGMFRGGNPHAARIDRTNAVLGPNLPVGLGDITGDGLAFSAYGGAFYIFLLPHNSSTSVYRMNATDGSLDKLLTKTGQRVISTTVAACL